MAKIYLCKEHEQFQIGKSRLNRAVVFESNFVLILIILIMALAAIGHGGYALRKSWQYSQTGAEASATILTCDERLGNKNSYTSYLDYSYAVNGLVYEERARMGGRHCDDYQVGRIFPVFYLAEKPQDAYMGSFVSIGDWVNFGCFSGIGFLFLIGCFVEMMKNRREEFKYKLLRKHAKALINAEIRYIGFRHTGKSGYHYATYDFTAPDGGVIKGHIRSNAFYTWPSKIEIGDTLTILYLDDKNYCVL